MSQQILIIGLGQFGMSLAQTLSERGAEVLAVDRRRQIVEEAAAYVTESIVLDATDEAEVAQLEPAKRDAAVCAIGEESREASILCTAMLRQMGCPNVIARASSRMHQRILKMVGAHQIINPEQEFGRRFANRLLFKDVVVETSLGDDLYLTEIAIKPWMIGKNLIELALPKNYGILIAGIRHNSVSRRIIQPTATEVVQENDTLIIVSREAAISNLSREV